MSVLIFPDNPVDGQIYPPQKIPNINQYIWSSATNTWELLPPFGVQLIETGTGLEGGPITYEGTISIADTGVVEGSYTNANITVNAQGQITEVENGEDLQGVTEVDTGTGLTGGPITQSGTISIDDTGVVAGSYTNPTLSVNAQGQITEAEEGEPSIPSSIIVNQGDLIVGESVGTPEVLPVGADGEALVADSSQPLGVRWSNIVPPPSVIQTVSLSSGSLAPGQTENLWLDIGSLLSLVSVSVNALSEDAWLRFYSSEAAMLADTRVVPGPPFPASGLVAELVTTPLQPELVLQPVPQIYTDSGLFIRLTNQGATTQSYSLDLNYFKVVESSCILPPYGSNPYVNTSCVIYFSTVTGVLDGSTDQYNLIYTGGSNLLSEANNTYTGFVTGGSGTLGEFSLTRGEDGSIVYLAIYNGSDYEEQDSLVILGSAIGGLDGTDDLEIELTRDNGMGLLGAWEGGLSINDFPLLDTSLGVDFQRAWQNCGALTSFPLLDVSSGTDFSYSWSYCGGLTSFPLLNLSAGVRFYATWEECDSLVSFPLVNLSSGITFEKAWSYCEALTSFPLVDVSSGLNFKETWKNCTSLTSFPSLDFGSGINFQGAWSDCTSLVTFPAGAFDDCLSTNFINAWSNCALSEGSVDNILVSLDTAGQSDGTVNIDGGTSSAPGSTGAAAKLSLESKGWTVTTN